MRIKNMEKGFADFREIVIDLEMNSCREKRKPFEDPLYVGIVTLAGLEK